MAPWTASRIFVLGVDDLWKWVKASRDVCFETDHVKKFIEMWWIVQQMKNIEKLTMFSNVISLILSHTPVVLE